MGHFHVLVTQNLQKYKNIFTKSQKGVMIPLVLRRKIEYNHPVGCIYMNGEAMEAYEPRQVRKEAAINKYFYVFRYSYKCILWDFLCENCLQKGNHEQ